MANMTHVKNSFVSGEVSANIHQSSSNLEIYKGCLKQCHNYIPLRTRVLLRRLGTRIYSKVTEELQGFIRLVSFIVNLDLNYLFIFAGRKIVIYRREGEELVLDCTIETAYKGEDIAELDCVQNGDTLFIVHGRYPPYQLSLEARTWTYKLSEFQQSPMLGMTIVNEKPTKDITVHIPEGKVNSVLIYANGDLFKASDVGRDFSLGWHTPYWKKSTVYPTGTFVISTTIDGDNKTVNKVFKCIQGGDSGTVEWQATNSLQQKTGGCIWEVADAKSKEYTVRWATGSIAEVRTPRLALLNLRTPVQDDTPTRFWKFGAWGQDEGHPPLVAFHEDRLVFAGNDAETQSLHFSETSNYTNFSSTDESGDVQPDLAFSIRLSSTNRQDIQWMRSMGRGLLVGTDTNIWCISPSQEKGKFALNSVSTRAIACLSCTGVPPVSVVSALLFSQGSGQGLRAVMGDMERGYQFPDLTLSAEHMLMSGINQMAFQEDPYSILWILRNDGELIGCTFDPENQVLAWHRHSLGGKVHSMTSFIYSESGQSELWLLVERAGALTLEKIGDFQRDNAYDERDFIDGLTEDY